MVKEGVWELEFEAPKGSRIMKRFRTVTTVSRLWWCYKREMFVSDDATDLPDGGSTHGPVIRSVKAFKRFLRKHPELKGHEVILCSRFEDHNVVARYRHA